MSIPLHDPWQAVPKDRKWKYAYCERERRFLLADRPNLPEIEPAMHLLDKYITGSHFRLRKAHNGTTTEYKLQKKLRLKEAQTDQLWNSTIYISEAEYALFLPLPGSFLEKVRTFYRGPVGEKVCVDEIESEDGKIWIAEVEFKEEAEMRAYEFGLSYKEEVTNVAGWSSYDLAMGLPPAIG